MRMLAATNVCLLLICAVASASAQASSPYAQLNEALLGDYNPDVRPGSPGSRINVQMGMMVNAMRIEEWKIALHADAFPIMVWQDERLTWDPSNFSGIGAIRMLPTAVWRPDIALQNEIPGDRSTFASAMNLLSSKPIMVYSNGTVLWVPSVSLVSGCELDLMKFPKDKQTCTFQFGSWTYDSTDIEVQPLASKPIRMDYIVNTSPWTIASSSVEAKDVVYPDIEGSYSTIFFNFELERRISSYCLTVYLPIVVSIMGSIASWFASKNGASSAELTIAGLLNSGLLVAVIWHHSILLGISKSGAPCIMQFIGVLAALEALLLPLKTMQSNFAKKVKECKSGVAPLPHFASAMINFRIFGAKSAKGENPESVDKSMLVAAEEPSAVAKNAAEWNCISFTLWLTLAGVHAVGIFSSAFMLLP